MVEFKVFGCYLGNFPGWLHCSWKVTQPGNPKPSGGIGFAEAEKLFRYDVEVPRNEAKTGVRSWTEEPACLWAWL